MNYGYFDDERREYVITNPRTPVKWINYVGTLAFGGFVDHTGGSLICKGGAEGYQGLGIATFLYRMLIQHAVQRGLCGLTADVLASNKSMLKVFEKGEFPMQAKLRDGVYALTIDFKKPVKECEEE